MSELKTDFSIENDSAIETTQVRDVLNQNDSKPIEKNQVTNSNVTNQGETRQISNPNHTNQGASTEVPNLNAENQEEIIDISKSQTMTQSHAELPTFEPGRDQASIGTFTMCTIFGIPLF